MNNEKKLCGLYLRVSTENQVRDGFSLPEQKERLKPFCKFKGYDIVDYYGDAGKVLKYVPSTLAHHMAEGINKSWVANINSIFPKADLGFFIDITPEESIKRNTDAKFNIKASA